MADYVLLLTTADTPELADKLAHALIERRLAGCVNIVGPARSVYRWDGRIQVAEERLLLIKTTSDLVARVRQTIGELHTYDLPELLTVPISGGDERYLEWLRSELDLP
jgi:periplasmic divalent cation tolerance protein